MIFIMREMNLAGRDLNLLPALDALLAHRNVTRAAQQAGMSQPAMSRALQRLRGIFADPLLVRTAKGYVLTARGEALARQLPGTLDNLRAIYREPGFDPALAQRMVTLAATDMHTSVLVPDLMARLAAEAPLLSIRIEAIGPQTIARTEEGAIALAFATGGFPLPTGAVAEIIGRDRLALVMRQGHPLAHRAWQKSDYADYPHAAISLMGDGQSELDALLARDGIVRRMGLVTPYFSAALAAVAASDMVATVSETYARQFAAFHNLHITRPPFDTVEFELCLVWAHTRSGDPLLAWLIDLIKKVAEQQLLLS